VNHTCRTQAQTPSPSRTNHLTGRLAAVRPGEASPLEPRRPRRSADLDAAGARLLLFRWASLCTDPRAQLRPPRADHHRCNVLR